mgnify:FL=1
MSIRLQLFYTFEHTFEHHWLRPSCLIPTSRPYNWLANEEEIRVDDKTLKELHLQQEVMEREMQESQRV